MNLQTILVLPTLKFCNTSHSTYFVLLMRARHQAAGQPLMGLPGPFCLLVLVGLRLFPLCTFLTPASKQVQLKVAIFTN